jgi:mannosyltransferase OCH1-like enzyme
VTLLTKKNFFGYVNIPVEITSHPNFNDNTTRLADLIRVYALAEHGGVWIDSSILLKAPLDDWLFPTQESKKITKALSTCSINTSSVVISSNNGHDSFLIENEMLKNTIHGFINQN